MDMFAENPYSFQTHDAPFNKRLLCGRTQDIEKIVECFGRNESIALFGERRIGKTLLLYCLRDLISDAEPSQRPYQLIDIRLDTQWNRLRRRLGSSRAAFVNVQKLPHHKQASELFQQLIQESCAKTGLCAQTRKRTSSLVEFFENLAAELEKRSERLVVLVDEVEDLNRFEDSQQILVNLRSIIQSHSDRISFMFSGAEHWHQEVKYGGSPIANNLRQHYLRSPDSEDIRQFLIIKPLSQVLNVTTVERLVQDIIETTGGKPWFIQMICYFIWQRREDISTGSFDQIWELFLRDEVEEQTGSHLRNLYNRADKFTKRILKTLSVFEPQSAKQIAQRLSMPKGDVFKILDDLEELDRVRSQKDPSDVENDRYRFADKINREWWRERAGDIPAPFPWRKVLGKVIKWGVVGMLLIIALFFYSYTYPRLDHHLLELAGCAAEVWYPLSVEDSEEGKIRVVISNREISSTAPITATASLSSAFVDYSIEGSNMLQVTQLRPGEKKGHELGYLVHPSVPVPEIRTELTLASAEASKSSTFAMQRRLPVKRYLIPFEALIVALAGLIARKEITQLIGAAFDLASGTGSSGKSSSN